MLAEEDIRADSNQDTRSCLTRRGEKYDQAILLSDILDLFCDQKLVNTFGYLIVINLSIIFNNNLNTSQCYICY